MESRQPEPPARAESPRPSTQRQRSNSYPIVEALGCSTPEAQLLLAEGRAAVSKRRAHSRRNHSVNDGTITTFDPRHHLDFLNGPAPAPAPVPTCEQQRPAPFEARNSHARIPSDASDRSTATVVAQPREDDSRTTTPTNPNPLGNYSANLAQFIKAQLRNIPTYTPGHDPTSPRSCPDLSIRAQTPPQPPNQVVRRPIEAPKVIQIPPIRPPMQSQFSAWSSADDDTDDDVPSMPNVQHHYPTNDNMSKGSNYTPSVLGFYEGSTHSSFLFSSTPVDEEEEPDTAKAFTFPDQSAELAPSPASHHDGDYPSSDLSRPQLTSLSAPSANSSASNSSYFDCKRPISLTAQLKDRIIAAVTPPTRQGKMLTAVSPWEGSALTNVHDVFVESQHRVHVDGMSFDMQRDFIMPNSMGTTC
ncbi:uncharacterized protein K460DRAFT_362861 [Cucurbitaria berberidis CBS 394.84]|uniref:Uncharacterized protein n=1 Tax=Cucurbitaria berberidis CBS 394.84 TaxID=1168544 RepID=A0A9P4GW46_9PLEO|nr:uncharacterized protein K460DRAFT_362861 [Cucurbitaria berberidis CBS 394.84]KAF1852101.1 hypothetical protein K460DRAFT_362861 [Cucurbitaria berberidis CBS 394.84]